MDCFNFNKNGEKMTLQKLLQKCEQGVRHCRNLGRDELSAVELEEVKNCYMRTFRYGGESISFEPTRKLWYKLSMLKNGMVASHLVCDYMNSSIFRVHGVAEMVEEHPNVAFSEKRAVRSMIRWVRQRTPKVVDSDFAILEDAAALRSDLCHMRDLDRSYRIGVLSDCGTRADCDRCDGFFPLPRLCECGGCIRHCLLRKSCRVPRESREESVRDRKVVEVQKKTCRFHSRGSLRLAQRYKRGCVVRGVYRKLVNFGEAHGLLDGAAGQLADAIKSFRFPTSVRVQHDIPVIDAFVEALNSKDDSVPWKKIIMDFAFMVAHIFVGNRKSIMLSVMHFIGGLSVTTSVMSWLLARVPKWFASNAHSVGCESLMVPLMTLFGVVITVLGIKAIPSDKSVTEFIMRLSKIGACIKSLEVVKDYIQPAVAIVIDYIRVHFFGYSSADLDAWKSYNEYCDEVQALNNTGFEDKLKFDAEVVNAIDDLLQRGDVLMKQLDQLRVDARQRTRFNAAYAWVTRMRSEAAGCAAGKHIPRVPPVIFHLVGATGVGKSEATSLLNARLLTALGHTDPNDLNTKIYYRDCGQERFDGYNSAIVGVVVDDFGSRVDTVNNPSAEVFEVIRMQNSAVWQLPMASLAEKGSTFFRAKFVIWTSNQPSFKFESVTNPEAVMRRVSLKFVQKPRPEFAKTVVIGKETVQNLDYLKIAEAAKTRPDIYEDVWLFDQIDPTVSPSPKDEATGGHIVIQPNLSFDQMAAMCEATLATAQRVGKSKLDHTFGYFQKCVEKRGPAHGCDWFGRGRSADRQPAEDSTESEATAGPSTAPPPEPSTSAGSTGPSRETLFGIFGAPGALPKKHTHIEMRALFRKHTWDGDDLTPHWANLSELVANKDDDWTELLGKKCIVVAPKLARTAARSLYQAYFAYEKQMRAGANGSEAADAFNLVLNSSDLRPSLLSVCQEHQNHLFWDAYSDFRDWVSRKNTLMQEMYTKHVPESWQPYIAGTFECLVNAMLLGLGCFTFLATLSTANAVWSWLFPHLDVYRRMKAEQLERLEKVMSQYGNWEDAPANVLFLWRELKRELEQDVKPLREGIVENYLGELESHQDRTTGSVRRNVETSQRSVPAGSHYTVESMQDRTNGMKRGQVEAGTAEATSDQNAKEIAWKMEKNVYGIHLVNDDNSKSFVGNMLFTTGKIAVTNKHIWNIIRGKTFIIFNTEFKRGFKVDASMKLNTSEVTGDVIHGYKDIIMVEMPRHVLVHADITSLFMKREDFCRHTELANVGVFGYGSNLRFQSRYSDKCRAQDSVFQLVERNGVATNVREWYRYGVHSEPGDCGSVVVAFDASVQRKICGIHMAGYNSGPYHGVAVAVHQELLQSLRDGLKLENVESGLDGTFIGRGGQCDDLVSGEFVNFGNAAAKTGSSASVIKPSPIHGVLATPITKPARLRPFYNGETLVDPLELARKKADTVNVCVDVDILKQCSFNYTQVLMDLKLDDRDDRVLSWEQSIRGDPTDALYTPIKRNTSPGFGWEAKGQGKEPWLGVGETYVVDHPDVIAKRDEMLARLDAGMRASTVFSDTLKDERRTLDKVQAGKTRLFAAGEMVFCLLFRQYFMGFNAHIMRNCVDAESTVGINPFGLDWSRLAERMRCVGPHVVAGDFSNYDGTLSSAVLWECYDIVESFYEKSTEEDRRRRRGLWCELVNSVHYTVPFEGMFPGKEGYLYQWSHSQPSGNPMTVILNSVYHSVVARYVYKLCAQRYCPEKASMLDWSRYVRHNNYGDDDLYNISPEIIDWFNQETMTEMFVQLGMTYTDEAKTGKLVKSRSLGEVAFLKRRFLYDSDQARWRCPLSLETILEMSMWVKRGSCVYALTAETLQEAVHELAQHPRDVFMKYIGKFYECRKIIVEYADCVLDTYEGYQETEIARLGQLPKPCDRGNRKIAEIDVMTAAVGAASGVNRAQSTERESYSALEATVCPLQNIGLSSGTPSTGLSGPAHSALNNSLATQETHETSSLQTETEVVVEQEQIMTFHEEGEVNRIDEVVESAPRVFRQLNDLGDTLANDVVGFLERPIHTKDFVWKATEVDAVQLFKIQFPRVWIENKMIREKLAGFRYVKCDFKVRVQVNAQPFNAGLLMMVFVPLEEQQTATVSSLAGFAGLTGYRHVLLDLSMDTACELTIPYIGLVSHFDLLRGYGSMGAVKLMVYSPLTGTDDVDGTVWVTATNVEVALPTGLDQLVASGPAHSRSNLKKPAAPPTDRDAALNTAPPKKKGPVSSVADAVGTVAGVLKDVPVIGSVASTVEWVSGAVSSVASWFGFSKPADTAVPAKTVLTVASNWANFDGDAKVKSLAFSWSNETQMPTDVFGTEEDEMSFSHVLSVPNLSLIHI